MGREEAKLPKELVEALAKPEACERLYITVSEVPPEIAELPNLKELRLQAPDGELFLRLVPAIAKLSKLEHLWVNAAIDEIPPWLDQLPSLTTILLAPQSLDGAGVLARVPRLEHLELSMRMQPEGEIEPPEALFAMPAIKKLVLSGRFCALPDAFANMTALEDLQIAAPTWPSLPVAITRLPSLRKLQFWADAVPAEIGRLKKLEELKISSWKLTALPEELGDLANLQALRVSAPLNSLPERLGGLTELRVLSLTGEKLTTLPASIGRLAKLRELDVAGSPIASIPDELGEMAELVKLSLSNVRAPTLPASIGRLKKLRTIWSIKSALRTLPPEISGCEALTTLYLPDCAITALPAEIGRCAALEHVSLTNNPISELPAEILACKKLEMLDLTGCTFSPEAMRRVDALAEQNCFRELRRPRLGTSRPAPPTIASRDRLAPDVVAELSRLGAKLESPPEPPATPTRETKGGVWPIPEAIRQITRDIRWPNREWDSKQDFPLRRMLFGIRANLAAYECDFYHPYESFGQTDGGNYILLVDLSDPQPTNPRIYVLDHDSWKEPAARATGLSLSEFLASIAG